MIKIAPSLLAADMLHMGRDIEKMLDNGINLLHFDVMDAHFVPNLSFSPAICKAVHDAYPDCLLDVHLMMDNPLDYLQAFRDAGAYTLTMHLEALEDPAAAMQAIRNAGMRCGLSVKPQTPAEALIPYLDQLDHILVMTVNPGFGGQAFMPEQVEKIQFLRKSGFAGDIGVDGGINARNAQTVIEAGANVLVLGTAYFKAADPGQVVKEIEEFQ